MNENSLSINRAPVLTLWAAVVAERLGFDPDEALSLGKSVAGLNAQSKGQRLGVFQPSPKDLKAVRQRQSGVEFRVELCGRAVPAINTDKGVRAVNKAKPVASESVKRYLESKFGDHLPAVCKAMKSLADRLAPADLAERAFRLYEQFRPAIPAGAKGWGAHGKLNLERFRQLS